MPLETTVEQELETRPDRELGASIRRNATVGDPVQRWLEARLSFFVFAVIAAAFYLRAHAAGWGFLNPDEGLHYIILNQRSVEMAYDLSLTNAHPPLIYLLLYYWRFLGSSELMLRMPSVLAGTAFCWFAYKWIATLFGRVAGTTGLILVAFSPVMIALSAEVRSYALLLFCETAALYFAETALLEKSARKLWLFFGFLYLAILSHYSAVFLTVALGVYMLARLAKDQFPREFIARWAAGQAGALAIYGFLYVTHVSKLKSYVSMWAVSFDKAYSHTGHEKFLTYARERTLDIFTFLFENHLAAQVLCLLWIAAVAALLLRNWTVRWKHSLYLYTGMLMILPLLCVFTAGVAGLYPYVGSRHTIFLAPFLIAALSFLFTRITREKLWAAMLIGFLLIGISDVSAKEIEPYIAKENQSRTLMKAAMDHIHQTIPPGSLIMTDYQSALLLVYYLCGPELILPVGMFNLPTSRLKCNGYTIASFQAWDMQAPFFLSQFGMLARAQRVNPGANVWIFQSGWDPALAQELPLASPQFRCVKPTTFGGNISLFQLAVGPDFSPIPPGSGCL